MIDYLKFICDSLGIQLFYNNNKALVLSTDVKNDVPILRANKTFEFCPESVAKAIINYYIGEEDKNAEEEKFTEYLNGSFNSDDSYFKNKVIKNLNKEKVKMNEDSSLVEYEIVTLVSKDYFGNKKQYTKEEPLTLSNSNLLEVEVNIKPLDTYERRWLYGLEINQSRLNRKKSN